MSICAHRLGCVYVLVHAHINTPVDIYRESVRGCVRACVCSCVCVCMPVWVCVCTRARLKRLATPSRKKTNNFLETD